MDDDAGEEIGKEDAYKPERMTTLTSFSSLEISDLEVKGLILSLFQVLFFLWFVGEYLKDDTSVYESLTFSLLINF